uniref:Acylphosphatase-like domain-containing protein n=1 Tax=Mola mola TaxID=94237 RepID=A0A3Q3W6M8_MOLML
MQMEGLRLGLVGWVRNTHGGTVVGHVQGPAHKVHHIRITRASFSNERSIDKLELSGFTTRF